MNQIINYCLSVCDPLENIKLHSGARLVMMASELVPRALHQMVFQEILPWGDINNFYTLLISPSDKPKYHCLTDHPGEPVISLGLLTAWVRGCPQEYE